jgi:hypothetical protein
LQNNDGRIREAARNTGDWLVSSLTHRASPFIYPKSKELTEKQKSVQKIAEIQYLDLVKEMEALIEKYDDGRENNVEYVDEMKPSVHKSLQQMWNRLTECPVYREILEKTIPVPLNLFMKRKEIEANLTELIESINNNNEYTDIDYIKQIIYEENGTDDMQGIFSIFDTGDVSNLSNVLETLTDAWNYFPHRSLSGLSPVQKSMEYRMRDNM